MLFRQVDKKNMYIGYSGWYNVLKSYDTIIAILHKRKIYINEDYYNCSKTTARHLYLFLGVDSREFKRNAKNGEYYFLPHEKIMEMYYSIS